MRKLFFFISTFAFAQAFSQNSFNINLLGSWNNTNLPQFGGYQRWSDLTGYYDSLTQKEYVILGSTDSIYFFDVTNPSQIKLCDVRDGISKNMVNRDFECFSHYAYCVSDNGIPGAFQIFDLQYLPDSVHLVYQSDSLAKNTHSIFIDRAKEKLYMCTNRPSSGGRVAMDILSLQNPENPTWIGRLKVPVTADGAEFFRTVHEVYVKNDTAYCSVEYYGLWMFDLSDLNNQKIIGTITNYTEAGYNHNSWLSPDGKNIVFTDEVPAGLGVKIFNINDPWESRFVSIFRSNAGAIAHNPVWLGNFIYLSYYHDGFYIFNAADITNPRVHGWFRTSDWPPPSYEGYKGNWGVYPFFPSGNIALSDMANGLFMVKADTLTATAITDNFHKIDAQVYPTLIHDNLLQISSTEPVDVSILTINGIQVIRKTNVSGIQSIDLSLLSNGIYVVKLNNRFKTKNIKIVKY